LGNGKNGYAPSPKADKKGGADMNKTAQKPTLQHQITDAKTGVKVEIFAFRKLNRQEMALTLLEAQKGKKHKRGDVLQMYASFH
jgi:hypothetical protein